MTGSLHVLVVGSGAREHALAWAIARSPHCGHVLVAPGNGGTAGFATNVAVAADDPAGIVRAAGEHSAGLVVIGPDAAIAAGVGDACRAAGIPVVGPTAEAGRVESSKEFAKRLMDAAGIPTARWTSGSIDDFDALMGFASELRGRCVVKADGLALGKGVTVCDSTAEAAAAIHGCFRERRFGSAGDRVLVEERLEGREVSVLALTDGLHVRALVPACDYKRAGDGDIGPMTGGMGAYAPPADLDAGRLLAETLERVVEPAVLTLAERGTPYSGCLYAGLMLTPDGLRVLEFNARFGDPEAQVVLPLVGDDVLALLLACAVRDLPPGRPPTPAESAVGIVVAAAGYPGTPVTGDEIEGLDELDDGVLCFHAGTRRDAGTGAVRTSGGRVLTVVARDGTLDGARARALANARRIRFPGAWHRSDIAAVRAGAAVAPVAPRG